MSVSPRCRSSFHYLDIHKFVKSPEEDPSARSYYRSHRNDTRRDTSAALTSSFPHSTLLNELTLRFCWAQNTCARYLHDTAFSNKHPLRIRGRTYTHGLDH